MKLSLTTSQIIFVALALVVIVAGWVEKKKVFNGYMAAADRGSVIAQYNVGSCYASGQGVFQDDFEAVKWYRKAADLGNATAQFYLAECYSNGRGVAKDVELAEQWYRKAAEGGSAGAQFHFTKKALGRLTGFDGRL
jgi:TPR repeat protein